MIQLSKDVAEKLEKMRLLNAVIHHDEEAVFDDDLMDEYRGLQEALVEEFMPLMEKLSKAGLLTVSIGNFLDDDAPPDEHFGDEYTSVSGEPMKVFQNGNIVLHADEVSGATCRQKKAGA